MNEDTSCEKGKLISDLEVAKKHCDECEARYIKYKKEKIDSDEVYQKLKSEARESFWKQNELYYKIYYEYEIEGLYYESSENESNIHRFLDDLSNLPYPQLEMSDLAIDMRRRPSKYSLIQLEDRIEEKVLGEQSIPYIDAFCFEENEWYKAQNEEYKKSYPEFNDHKVLAIIEEVKDVEALDKKNIRVIIERYLIMVKEDKNVR